MRNETSIYIKYLDEAEEVLKEHYGNDYSIRLTYHNKNYYISFYIGEMKMFDDINVTDLYNDLYDLKVDILNLFKKNVVEKVYKDFLVSEYNICPEDSKE